MTHGTRRSTGWLRLESATDALYSVLERFGKTIGLRQLPRSGSDDNTPGQHARRLISIGAKGGRAPREYRTGFGWHTLFLYVLLPLVLALVLAPKELIEQIPGVPRSYVPIADGDVIVVSARGTHREAVISTAQPRGYSVVAVKSVKAALDALTDRSATLRFVVIDRDSAGTAALKAAVQKKSQAARIVLLPEGATTAEIANQLIQAGLR